MPDSTSDLGVEGTAGPQVRMTGDLDTSAADELASRLQSVPVGPHALTVDLRSVTYVDSAAVAVLYRHVRRGLRILVRDGTAVAMVLRICGLTAVCDVRFLPA
jgi:anti-anti-sigma factor